MYIFINKYLYFIHLFAELRSQRMKKKINKHRKEWTNPIRIIRSRDYQINELSKAGKRDINVIEILDKLMTATRANYQFNHFLSNYPVTPLIIHLFQNSHVQITNLNIFIE